MPADLWLKKPATPCPHYKFECKPRHGNYLTTNVGGPRYIQQHGNQARSTRFPVIKPLLGQIYVYLKAAKPGPCLIQYQSWLKSKNLHWCHYQAVRFFGA